MDEQTTVNLISQLGGVGALIVVLWRFLATTAQNQMEEQKQLRHSVERFVELVVKIEERTRTDSQTLSRIETRMNSRRRRGESDSAASE